ncbi:Phosphatidylserine decarboxylase proenzyme [Durusdinium trenchii]|uniref:Phosphatidylserine decarboxylase proenzyme n=1 Tax=Durusdinium trenchii TaxID=1381693 RepID=A0ABP0N4D0_9DINO
MVQDVRIWQLGPGDFGTLRAQFTNLRSSAGLMRNEDEDFSFGYVVETFYDQPSAEVFLLAGAGTAGDLLLFRVTLAEAVPAAVFSSGGGNPGHSGIVRSALCLPGGRVLTAGEKLEVISKAPQRDGPLSDGLENI